MEQGSINFSICGCFEFSVFPCTKDNSFWHCFVKIAVLGETLVMWLSFILLQTKFSFQASLEDKKPLNSHTWTHLVTLYSSCGRMEIFHLHCFSVAEPHCEH